MGSFDFTYKNCSIVKANREAEKHGFEKMLFSEGELPYLGKNCQGKDLLYRSFFYDGHLYEGIIMSGGGFNAPEHSDGASLSGIVWQLTKDINNQSLELLENIFGKTNINPLLDKYKEQYPRTFIEIGSKVDLTLQENKYFSYTLINYCSGNIVSAVPVCVRYILDRDKWFDQLYIVGITRKLVLERIGFTEEYRVVGSRERDSYSSIVLIGSREDLYDKYKELYNEDYPIRPEYIPDNLQKE